MVRMHYKKNLLNIKASAKLASSLLLIALLTGCSTYSGKFTCGDSRGAPCVMLSEIDKKINSGEIVEVYKDKKCKSGKCSKDLNSLSEPKLKDNQTHRALMIENKDEVDHREGDYLYVK